MGKLFGTDGIRGSAGEYPLDQQTVGKIGSAFAEVFRTRLGRHPKFISGRDTRESGREIEAAFHAGAGSTGESAGVMTTPGIAFLTREFDFDAGIVISASHNPFRDNGIKIFLPSGEKVNEEIEAAIEATVSIIPSSDPHLVDLTAERASEFRSSYFEHLAGEFPDLDLTGIRIVADCANGAASEIAPDMFLGLGADVIVINASPDGRNINQDCGSLHLEKLRSAVIHEKADFGVAFDGDADRALFVDEQAEVVDGDAALWILAKYLNQCGGLPSGRVVATVMSNIGLERALANNGIELIRTSVGDKYVLEELMRCGSELGGEQSGHIIVPKTSLVGDGIMTALFILQAIQDQGQKFSEAHAGFVKYPQILVNVHVREKRPFYQVPAIANAAGEIEDKLGGEGRLLLRYSGTENLARVMIEGKDQSEIEALAASLADVIRKELG
jgi:phosphoglucosamine mutase